MRVAVIGGTGFVGSHIVDALVSAQHDVSLLVRPGSEHKVVQQTIWRTTSGDVSDTATIDAALADCDAVIYSVGLLREFPKQQITYENTQFDGVVRTIASARRQQVDRFLLVSANGVKVPGTKYQETKHRAEQELLDSGLSATIFKPSVIFGDPRDTMEFATQLYRDMVAPPIPAIGFFSGLNPSKGHVRMSPVHIADVATAVCNSLEQEAAVGMSYVLGGPDILSWHEMIHRIAAATDNRKWIIPMPIAVMKFAALLFDWLPFFPVTRDQLTMLAENNIADPAVLSTLVGRELTPFDSESLSYLNTQDTK